MASLNLVEGELSVSVGMLGCEQVSGPIKYLGLSLGSNPRSPNFWQPILEKMSKRLRTWKKIIYRWVVE